MNEAPQNTEGDVAQVVKEGNGVVVHRFPPGSLLDSLYQSIKDDNLANCQTATELTEGFKDFQFQLTASIRELRRIEASLRKKVRSLTHDTTQMKRRINTLKVLAGPLSEDDTHPAIWCPPNTRQRARRQSRHALQEPSLPPPPARPSTPQPVLETERMPSPALSEDIQALIDDAFGVFLDDFHDPNWELMEL